MPGIFQMILLAILQGITEIFPVSSSGHLVIMKQILGFKEQGIIMETSLHFGTLLAILVYFRKDIVRILSSLFTFRGTERNLALYIIVGSIPAGLIGVLFESKIESCFSSAEFVASMLLLNGVFLVAVNFLKEKDLPLNPLRAFLVGVFQAIAILPGISRSGSTVGGGIICGLKRENAFAFSFLLSIPAVLGALFLEYRKQNFKPSTNEIIGVAVAFIFGLMSLALFSKVVKGKRLYIFGIYSFLVGFLVRFFV